jgi:hypothetical protein
MLKSNYSKVNYSKYLFYLLVFFCYFFICYNFRLFSNYFTYLQLIIPQIVKKNYKFSKNKQKINYIQESKMATKYLLISYNFLSIYLSGLSLFCYACVYF